MRENLHPYAISFTLWVCTAMFVTTSAQTQERQSLQPPHNPLANLYACQNILPDSAKVACYDQVTQALQSAEQKGEIVTLNSETFKEILEGGFGYKHSPLSEFGLENIAKVNRVESITAPVKKIERYLSGYVITLDNGQVWEQFAGNISRVPKGDISAEINTTATGTYKMTLFTAKSRVTNIRVRRIQ